MTHNYYAIWDRAALKYVHVFESENDATSKRMFNIMENNQESFIGAKPEDFQLDYIGNFNDETGEFICKKEQLPAPFKICEGKAR